ncbi:MAG: hypothetical protein IKD76_06930 [Clostridia bacterium]|nr:hypothetical protein [Clostridia bacterium]
MRYIPPREKSTCLTAAEISASLSKFCDDYMTRLAVKHFKIVRLDDLVCQVAVKPQKLGSSIIITLCIDSVRPLAYSKEYKIDFLSSVDAINTFKQNFTSSDSDNLRTDWFHFTSK